MAIKMSSERVDEYSQRFLPEVKQAISALDHKVRLAVVAALEQHGDLSFTELMKLLAIEKSAFYYHLKQLMMAGIIKSYSKEKTEISPYTSYYSLTELGKSFMTVLSSALLPTTIKFGLRPPMEGIWKEKAVYFVEAPEAREMRISAGMGEWTMNLQELPKGKGFMFSQFPAEKPERRLISKYKPRGIKMEEAKW